MDIQLITRALSISRRADQERAGLGDLPRLLLELSRDHLAFGVWGSEFGV